RRPPVCADASGRTRGRRVGGDGLDGPGGARRGGPDHARGPGPPVERTPRAPAGRAADRAGTAGAARSDAGLPDRAAPQGSGPARGGAPGPPGTPAVVSSADVPAEVRARVRAQAGDRCGYCLSPQWLVYCALEIEHIVPTAHGGTDEEENLWLACRMC